jgi:predicted transcriptional regulator of viral defense system
VTYGHCLSNEPIVPTATSTELYDLAEGQHGYFTIAQAKAAGILPNTVVKMASRRIVERISHGVYRIVNFPVFVHGQLLDASLWPLEGVRGVISHDSALRFHQMSDVSPAKVHITIPMMHRVRRSVPKYLVVHRTDLAPTDVEMIDGIPVTTPGRSIIDAHEAHLGPALIRQAIEDGRRSGRLRGKEAESLAKRLLGRVVVAGESRSSRVTRNGARGH